MWLLCKRERENCVSGPTQHMMFMRSRLWTNFSQTTSTIKLFFDTLFLLTVHSLLLTQNLWKDKWKVNLVVSGPRKSFSLIDWRFVCWRAQQNAFTACWSENTVQKPEHQNAMFGWPWGKTHLSFKFPIQAKIFMTKSLFSKSYPHNNW